MHKNKLEVPKVKVLTQNGPFQKNKCGDFRPLFDRKAEDIKGDREGGEVSYPGTQIIIIDALM